jgi:hypothetical protein
VRYQARLCSILGMGLFGKILDDSYISTEVIIIQHNATHFVPVFDSPAPETAQSDIQHLCRSIKSGGPGITMKGKENLCSMAM